MNHQIEYHIDVRAAMLEWREPRGLYEAGNRQYGLHRLNGGVEAPR